MRAGFRGLASVPWPRLRLGPSFVNSLESEEYMSTNRFLIALACGVGYTSGGDRGLWYACDDVPAS